MSETAMGTVPVMLISEGIAGQPSRLRHGAGHLPQFDTHARDPRGSFASSKDPVRRKPFPFVTTSAQMKRPPNSMIEVYALKAKKYLSLRTGMQASGAWGVCERQLSSMAGYWLQSAELTCTSQRMRNPIMFCVVMPRPSGSGFLTLPNDGQIALIITLVMAPPWSGAYSAVSGQIKCICLQRGTH